MKRTRLYVLCALILAMTGALVLLAGCGAKKQEAQNSNAPKTLKVAMELAYPPFETKDKAGNPAGVSVDIIRDFAKKNGYTAQIENTAWDGLIPSLQTGKADVVISSMTITDERKQTVDFTKPYANSYLALLTNKKAGIKKASDLDVAGKKVAVKTGSTGDAYATKNLKKAEVIRLADESACVTEVVQGKADAFIYDQLTIYRNQKEHADTTDAVFIPFQDVDKWGMAVKKGNTELLGQLNAYIDGAQKAGTFDAISEKYLSKEKETFKKFGFKWFFDLSDAE